MAEENQQSGNNNVNVESSDRGLFDFMKKKKEDDHSKEEEVIATEFEHKVEVPKEDEEKKEEGGLLHKLHRSDSSSSSSSDEEGGDDEEKKRRKKEKKEKKKGLKEKIMEKFPGHHDDVDHVDTHVPVEKVHVEEVVYSEPSHPTPTPLPAHHYEAGAAPDEKKGLLEKIKDKLPGQHKRAEEDHHADVVAPTSTTTATADVEGQEKKGFLEKIKEKIPGFHPKPSEEEKKEDEKREY